jgi:CheY-like chemotaxis protein
LEFLDLANKKDPGHILVVEDDTVTQKLVKRILIRNDYKVFTADNGAEAVTILKNGELRHVDIVITDYHMPEMNGYELTSYINENHPHIPVVIMSGADQEELDKITELNIKGCLLKPVNSMHLLNTLQRIYAKVLRRRMEDTEVEDHSVSKWAKGRGCKVCKGSGYKGRMGIYEIFHITPEIQEMIYKQESSASLRARARGTGMRTLRDDGVRKAAAGMTTIEEVVRVSMENESDS